mmetsp:Transcript_9943/g.17067  ORF Transcript_9943/g.17067 Transcript_9943/m.17067 type:complete len:215 (+) Transcript_9943:1017-1661(+)
MLRFHTTCALVPALLLCGGVGARSEGLLDVGQLGGEVVRLRDGVADVGHGGESHQLGLGLLRHVLQVVHKLPHGLLRHALPARESLQLLVRLRHRVPAHDGLDGLGQHLPVGVQVFKHGRAVRQHLGDAPESALVAHQRLCKPHPQVADHRAVRQVPLPPGDGQLVAEVVEHGVGHPEVALAVLKVDRVHFVRHGGGPHLPGNGALPEVSDGNV